MEILPTATDLAEEALIRSSEGCRALAALLLARAELLERYARLLATAADQLERIEEAPVRRLHPRSRVSQD